MTTAAVLNENLNKIKHFMKFSQSFIIRNNPILSAYRAIIEGIKGALTANKKLKIAQYRVNHLKYRLYQMEQLIDQGNPYNRSKGKTINFLR
jgi:hypothetical protein